jgi:uncharacterized coiled-coil DUF342 family protein
MVLDIDNVLRIIDNTLNEKRDSVTKRPNMDFEEIKEEWKARKMEAYEARLEQKSEVATIRAAIVELKQQRRELLDEIRSLQELLPPPVRRRRRAVDEVEYDDDYDG